MKKKIGLLLATVMVLNSMSAIAYGWTNPLKSYNLYEDTHPSNAEDEGVSDRETVMDEFYSNSMAGSGSSSQSSSSYEGDSDINIGSDDIQVEVPQRRNDYLRESSRKVYGTGTPGWLEGPVYYSNPSFESIKEKYRQSNFAGCLQECIAYVRQNPYDTLGFYYLAMCYSKVSDKENAILAYEKVIELNDNPMIVKYATNGRNCVMGSDDAKCYPNVNEPELLRPYEDIANTVGDLTPIDPQTLIDQNLADLQRRLSPPPKKQDPNAPQNDKDKKEVKVNLPFGDQDAKLDAFINAPYGNGLSPDLNNQYKQIQLKKIQQNLNNDDKEQPDLNILKNIQKFDDHKTDAETLKIAFADTDEIADFTKDPDYIQSKKELEQLRMLLGSDSDKSSNDDMMDLVMSGEGKNLSPEVIQTMMMKSMMSDLTL